MDFKFCPKCGNKLPKDALFCNSCGEKMPTVQQERSNVVNSSQPESITKQEPSTPKVEEQLVSNENASESSENSQTNETLKFLGEVIVASIIFCLMGSVTIGGAVSLVIIAYLSYRFFVKKWFESKKWSMKFASVVCFVIGMIAVSAISGRGSGSISTFSSAIDKSEFGTYEFSDDFNTWELTINKDKTCTMLNKSKGDGVYCYGSWQHFSYEEKNSSMYKLKFTDLVPRVWFEGEQEITNMYYPVLEAKGMYIYMNTSAYDAQNPNRRIQVKKTK